jgi:hypothetical protein
MKLQMRHLWAVLIAAAILLLIARIAVGLR